MQILFLGDIHNKTERLKKIDGPIDYALITGDLTIHGGRKEALKILEEIKAYFPKFFAVSGNMDLVEVEDLLEELGVSLHGKGFFLDEKIGVFGCGGSSPTPFHTPNEISEEKICEILEKGYAQIEKAAIKIMVCHTPPFNTPCDRIPNGMHVGSKKVREWIEQKSIDFYLTGHIHEGVGSTTIGKTLVANPGAFLEGGYGILDTDKKEITLF